MKLIELQLPKNKWKLIMSGSVKNEIGDELVDLVQNAYVNTNIGSHINDLKDVIPSDWHIVDWDKDPDIDVTVFYRKPRPNENWVGNKIQGIGHDGQRKSKEKALKKLEELLNKDGWWIEASDAMRGALGKINVPLVNDPTFLRTLFNDPYLTLIDRNTYSRQLENKRVIIESVFGKPKLKSSAKEPEMKFNK